MSTLKKLMEEKVVDREKVKKYVYMNKEENIFMKKAMLMMGAMVSTFLIGVSAYFMFMYEKPAPVVEKKTLKETALSYLIVDINPTVELGVDEANQVVEVTPLNEDAAVAYSDLDLIGEDVDTAVTTLVDTATEMGYITEVSATNAVTVTTTDETTEATTLQEGVETTLNEHFTRKGLAVLVLTAGLDDALKAKADTYDIPYGKMLLVNRAMELDSTLVEADLVKLTVKEIQEKVKAKVKVLIDEKRAEYRTLKEQKINEAKTKLQAEKDALFAAAEKEKGSPLTPLEKRVLLQENLDTLKADVEAARAEVQKARQERREAVTNIKERYILKRPGVRVNTTTTNTTTNTTTQTQTQTQTQAGNQ